MWTLAVVLALSVEWPGNANGATQKTKGRTADLRPDLRTLDADAQRRAVAAALELVPRRSKYEVVILDLDLAADPTATRRPTGARLRRDQPPQLGRPGGRRAPHTHRTMDWNPDQP